MKYTGYYDNDLCNRNKLPVKLRFVIFCQQQVCGTLSPKEHEHIHRLWQKKLKK